MSAKFTFKRTKVEVDEDGEKFVKVYVEDDMVLPTGKVDMLVIPGVYEGHRCKMLWECCANVLCDVVQGLTLSGQYPKHKRQRKVTRNTDGMLLEVVHAVRHLAHSMQYMVNSTSWMSDSMHGFDLERHKKDLDIVRLHLEHAQVDAQLEKEVQLEEAQEEIL